MQSWARHFDGRRHLGRRPVVTLRVSYRFMAQTAPEPHLMLSNDNFLDQLRSDRGKQSHMLWVDF